ncbi:MAG: hypothetical protein JSV21_11165 [Nitrospirota bacterium]|nr:MAG: hypothetical protein JSV21_11165 [Nitrospirota bacterium]
MSFIKSHVHKIIVLFFIAIISASCSDGNSNSVFSSDTGHPNGWTGNHGQGFFNSPDICSECHGTDLLGGISTVSCFSADLNGISCHAGGPPGHPNPFSDPDTHGAVAKAAPGFTSGFAFCSACHGTDFSGGISGISCYTCHGVSAPHSPQPWRNGRTHIDTHFDNADSCAECHYNDPINPAPQPGSPGCFNSTLCHAGVHDTAWTTDHVLTARFDQSSCSTSNCHGTDLTGGLSGISCYRCHLGGPVPGSGIMHPNRWTDPENSHPNYVENRGGNASSCSPTAPSGANVAQYCHGTDLLSGSLRIAPPNGSWSSAPSCFSCHGKEWSVP